MTKKVQDFFGEMGFLNTKNERKMNAINAVAYQMTKNVKERSSSKKPKRKRSNESIGGNSNLNASNFGNVARFVDHLNEKCIRINEYGQTIYVKQRENKNPHDKWEIERTKWVTVTNHANYNWFKNLDILSDLEP